MVTKKKHSCEQISTFATDTETKCCTTRQQVMLNSHNQTRGELLNQASQSRHSRRGPTCTRVSPLQRCVTDVCTQPADSARHFFSLHGKSLHFLCVSLPLRLQHLASLLLPLCHSAHRFTSKPDQLAWDASPGGPERPVFSPPFLHLSLGLSAGREQEGCGGLKGRTPDGHRHVGHVLCDGLWLRALWASHSCQS